MQRIPDFGAWYPMIIINYLAFLFRTQSRKARKGTNQNNIQNSFATYRLCEGFFMISLNTFKNFQRRFLP